MIRQHFYVEHYWKVIIYYNWNGDFSFPVFKELKSIGFPSKNIEEIFYELKSGNAKAVTCSNLYYHTSIILLSPHTSSQDYLDSIVHEAEHVKQAMLKAYRVEDRGELPAYTIGYLISRMYPVFKSIICNCR